MHTHPPTGGCLPALHPVRLVCHSSFTSYQCVSLQGMNLPSPKHWSGVEAIPIYRSGATAIAQLGAQAFLTWMCIKGYPPPGTFREVVEAAATFSPEFIRDGVAQMTADTIPKANALRDEVMRPPERMDDTPPEVETPVFNSLCADNSYQTPPLFIIDTFLPKTSETPPSEAPCFRPMSSAAQCYSVLPVQPERVLSVCCMSPAVC